MKKAVFLDSSTLGDTSLEPLRASLILKEFSTSKPEEIADRIRDAEIIITNKCQLNASNLKDAKKLKAICLAATGMDNIDLDYCRKQNISVRNVSSYSSESVCQFTLNLLFHYIHHNAYYFSYTKNGDWSKSPIFSHLEKAFFELKNKTWTIIGLGEIGSRLAEILEVLGLKIFYVSVTGSTKSKNYSRISLEEAFFESDIVSLHCQYSELSHHLISKDLLVKAKKKAILINLARGAIVDEQAIMWAIDNKKIEAYLSDVMSLEPPNVDHPFFQDKYKERIVLSPHIAWSSQEARLRLIKELANNIKEFL